MHEAAKAKFDRRIRELEERLKRLRALRAVLEDDALADELADAFQENGASARTGMRTGNRVRSAGNLEKIRQFFGEKNDWATAAAIANGTGVPKNSVRQLLYTQPEEFQRQSRVGGGRESLFRLKVEAEDGSYI